MDHAEVRELLELAAVEPGGLERLLGADQPGNIALDEHLADCRACRAELEAMRRSVATIRDAVQLTPSADLRHRTLEFVERHGRPRPAADAYQRETDVAMPAPRAGAGPIPQRWRWPSPVSAANFVAGVAASALIAGFVTWGAADARLTAADAAIAEQRSTIAGLGIIADWTLRVSGDPAASQVRLEAADGGAQEGTVLLAGERNELVMVASGLPVPAAGQEYRCWVETSGERVTIGRMYRAGELAYWVGELDQAIVEGELTFGVTLVDVASSGVTGDVVLIGAT
jgi:hypothetical protein